MPIYDYRCEACKTVYDVFHKGKEIKEDIVCPSCGSTDYKKLMSVPSIQISASGSPTPHSSCESGGCCGGSCGLN